MDIRDITIMSDMDGTLLSSEGKVSDKNKEAIRLFIASGGHFGIATGRGHQNVRQFLEGVMINAPSVLYNGAMLYSFETGKPLHVEYVPKEDLKGFLPEVVENFPDVMVYIYTPEMCCIVSEEAYKDESILLEHLPALFTDMEEAEKMPWIKVLFAGRNELLLEVEKVLEKRQIEGIRWVYSADIYLEVMAEGVSKAAMIRKMKTIHGKDHRIIALGDFYNDLEMLKDADYGIAMGNAPDDIKNAADETTVSNDEDGVAEIIEAVLMGKLPPDAKKRKNE